MRLAGLMGWGGALAVMMTGGCHHGETRYTVVAGVAPAPAVVEAQPAAPVVEAVPAEPAPVQAVPVEPPPAPAPVVVAPAPVVVAPAPVVVAPAPAVSISFFHTHLGHHGHWVTAASYGQVWVPAGVAPGWQPYTVGHWVYTDAYGWTWASDEAWGWATYHYGRWAFVEPHGWVWVPGTVWAPAWVVWRSGGGYVGWAPMPPAVVVAEPRPSVAININIGVNVVEHIRPAHWVFVREAHVLEPAHLHMIAVANNVTIINKTRHVSDIRADRGRIVDRSIPLREVERATGHTVKPLRVREVDSDAPGGIQVKKDEVVIPRLRQAAAGAQAGGKPRGGDNTTAQQGLTRTQTGSQATPRTTAEPKATPLSRSGKLPDSDTVKRTDTGTVKRTDGVTRTNTGTVTSGNSQTNKGDASVRNKVRLPDSTTQDKATGSQGQQTMRSGSQTSGSEKLDHYTTPFPPPVQPKVDPGPRRTKTLPPVEASKTLPPTEQTTRQQHKNTDLTTGGTNQTSTESSTAGTVSRQKVTRQPKVETAGEVRKDQGGIVTKRTVSKQDPQLVSPATSEKLQGDVQRDRSRTVKRGSSSSQPGRSGDSDTERQNTGSRRG